MSSEFGAVGMGLLRCIVVLVGVVGAVVVFPSLLRIVGRCDCGNVGGASLRKKYELVRSGTRSSNALWGLTFANSDVKLPVVTFHRVTQPFKRRSFKNTILLSTEDI